jgi:hypothetical protein
MTYAQARLRLGITGVGLFVVGSGLALVSGAAERLSLSEWLFLYALISLPLDLLGGQLLPWLFRAQRVPLLPWCWTYLRALFLHLTLWYAALQLLAWSPYAYLAALSAGLSLVLLASQWSFCGWVGIRQGQARDRRWSGGIVGLPGWERVIVAASCPVPQAQVRRYQGLKASHARSAGVILALLWSAMLAAWVGPLAQHQPVVFSCYATLVSFLGLLLLPSLSQPGVHYADQWASAEDIQALEAVHEEDGQRSRWVETIFHPIPSRDERLGRLGQKPIWAPWNVARSALLLSWWHGSLLSRAVHCNSGRPELWFWPPND